MLEKKFNLKIKGKQGKQEKKSSMEYRKFSQYRSRKKLKKSVQFPYRLGDKGK